jgi:hypothetical protein
MSSYLPTALTAPLTYSTDLLRSTLGSITFGPALTISKAAVTSLFSQIEVGTLVITDVSGTVSSYGQKIAKEHRRTANGVNGVNGGHGKKAGEVSKVELVVKKETFWVRLFLFADMGFAEAYMLGEVECADLTGFFQVRFPMDRKVEKSLRREKLILRIQAFHTKSLPALQCDDVDLVYRCDYHGFSAKHKYALELPFERLGALRYQ